MWSEFQDAVRVLTNDGSKAAARFLSRPFVVLETRRS
jgi:hypothetical protein